MAESHATAGLLPETGSVGPAVRQHVEHLLERADTFTPTTRLSRDHTRDPTHGRPPQAPRLAPGTTTSET